MSSLRRSVAWWHLVFFLLCIPVAARSDDRTPRQLLFDAVLWDNTTALDRALSRGVTLETRNEDGDTPLLWAVKNGASNSLLQTEAMLLQRGASLRARGRDGVSVWHAAPGETVPLLIRYGADVNERDAEGQTRLMREVRSSGNALVRLLLEHGANPNVRDKAGETALMITYSDYLPLLFAHGADINARDNGGETALMKWIWDGTGWGSHDAKDVAMLLRRGANVHFPHPRGSAVERAAKYLNVDIARTMLKIGDLTPRERALLQRGLLSDALFGAATEGLAENARKWLRRGADPNIVINDPQFDLNGLTPLMIAAQRPPNSHGETVAPTVARREEARDVEVARLLLARGADPNARVQSPTVGLNDISVLDYAIGANKPRFVEVLLRSGANPNLRSGDGETALFGAVSHPEVARVLLHYGTDPNARSARGRTALLNAALYGHPDVVRMLLAHGADPNVGVKKSAGATYEIIATPLIAAVHRFGRDEQSRAEVERESQQIARMLLHAGARLNQRDQFGQTALLIAAAYGNLPLTRLLLQAGAATEVPTIWGQTPLIAACAGRGVGLTSAAGAGLLPPFPVAAELLLQHGANPNARDNKGRTPLMAAALYDWRHDLGRGGPEAFKHIPPETVQNAAAAKRCLKLLLSHGANSRLRDKNGHTAYDWAKSQSNRDMTDLLKQTLKRA